MNFIKVEARGVAGDRAEVASAALDPISVDTVGRPIRSGHQPVLGVRPQYLRPSPTPAEGMLHGTVPLTERLGSETVIEVNLKDGTSIIAALAEDRVMEPGSEIGLTFDPDQAHLFAAP